MNALKYVTYHTPDTLKTVGNVVQAQQMFLEKGFRDDEFRLGQLVCAELWDITLPETWDNVVPLRV